MRKRSLRSEWPVRPGREVTWGRSHIVLGGSSAPPQVGAIVGLIKGAEVNRRRRGGHRGSAGVWIAEAHDTAKPCGAQAVEGTGRAGPGPALSELIEAQKDVKRAGLVY